MRRRAKAEARFICWDRSSTAWAIRPVGMCFTLTADSRLLRCWPPGPDALNVSISHSLCLSSVLALSFPGILYHPSSSSHYFYYSHYYYCCCCCYIPDPNSSWSCCFLLFLLVPVVALELELKTLVWVWVMINTKRRPWQWQYYYYYYYKSISSNHYQQHTISIPIHFPSSLSFFLSFCDQTERPLLKSSPKYLFLSCSLSMGSVGPIQLSGPPRPVTPYHFILFYFIWVLNNTI